MQGFQISGSRNGKVKVSMNLLPIQAVISKGLIRKELRNNLQHRAAIADLDARKLIPDSFIAPIICPSIKPKIEFYENIN